MQLGSDLSKGAYKLFGVVTSDFDIHDQDIDAVTAHDVWDIQSNALLKHPVKTTKAIVIHNLVNVLRQNDDDTLSFGYTKTDEISIGIYSDVYDQMFRCGDFLVSDGEVVDFDGLIVPCNEMIGISLLESDPVLNDGFTILIPCQVQDKDYDMLIRGSSDITKTTQTAVDITDFLAGFNYILTKSIVGAPVASVLEMAEWIAWGIDFSADWLSDSDAFYKLHVSGIEVDAAEIVIDHRITKGL